MIEDFYVKKKLPIPWTKRVSDLKAPAALRRGSSRDNTPLSSLRRPQSNLVSSNVSYLSDNSIERLRKIEDRLTKFKQIFTRMIEKLDGKT